MIQIEVEKLSPKGAGLIAGKILWTPAILRVIDYAGEEASNTRHDRIGPEHLVLALLREQEGVAMQVCKNLRFDLDVVRKEILKALDPEA